MVTNEDSECSTLLALQAAAQEAAGIKGCMPVPLAATRAASAMRPQLVHIDLPLHQNKMLAHRTEARLTRMPQSTALLQGSVLELESSVGRIALLELLAR